MSGGRVALVTGASRGIGAATAKRLAADGFSVVVSYCRQPAAADRVVAEIQQTGGEASAVQCDIGKESDVLSLFSEIDDRFARLDVLINNAGILERQCRVEELTVERLNRIFGVNVVGTFLCCREAARRMETGSAIVNISSVAARLGAAGEYVDYAASKGAIDTLTIGLARELAPMGIRVNGVRPGFIHTDIHADGGEPNRVDRVSKNLPIARGGTPEEVAEAVAWLVSDKSRYTTGDFIEVAGGR